jgi:hypothetical protein
LSSKQLHLERAARNEKLAEQLVKDAADPYFDWAVTVVFYAGVHYVEAYLASKQPPEHSGNRSKRDSNVKRDSVLGTLYDKYRFLEDDSRNARYEPHITIDSSTLAKQKQRLEILKNAVSPFL